MLAAIDDDSDQGPTVEHQGQIRKALSTVDANVQKVDERKQVAQESNLDDEEGEEEEDEESLFLPRGRLAARLGLQAAVREDPSPSSDGSPDENAYARIKKRLIPGNLKKHKKSVPETASRTALGHGEGETEATIPSRQCTPDLHSDRVHSPLSSLAKSRRSSPGLVLTPDGTPNAQKPNEKTADQDDSDSDSPATLRSKQAVLKLVARKKAEREAKQAAEDKIRMERIARQKSIETTLSADAYLGLQMSDEDRATDRMLTQQARPTRKASKKAIEEMSRETQRMSRNMQLTHQAKTKKKITKDSLFARFNFRTTATPTAEASQNPSSSTVVSSAPASDSEEAHNVQSPPTSPIEPDESAKKHADPDFHKIAASVDATIHATEQDCEDLPNLLDVMDQAAPKLDKGKGKGKAIDRSDVNRASESRRGRKTAFTQPPIKIGAPNVFLGPKTMELDSDSDLEVLPVKTLHSSRPDVFDRLPASKIQDGRSLQTLRALAHLTSPGKPLRGQKATMSLTDMQTSLQKRARQQAVEERAAKIEDLRSRGIVIQTAEERQQDQAEIEDMIEKARREGEEIMQKEKRAAKKAKIASGEVDDLPDTSDEDEDYQEGQGGEPEVELFSGSSEGEGDDSECLDELASDAEETANEDEEGGISLSKAKSGRDDLVIDEASEDGDSEEDEEVDIDVGIEYDEQPNEAQLQRSRRNKMVIGDDDDDDDDEDDQESKSGVPSQAETPTVNVPALPENPFQSNAVPMGMTQAFAATMANTQTQGDNNDEEQDSMAMFDSVPEPDIPLFDTNDSPDLVEDSQVGLKGPETIPLSRIELEFSQSQIQYDALGDTQDLHTSTQLSEIPDPTQDVGFALSSPAPRTRFVSESPSTVDTVLLSGIAGNGSPVKKKRGRLQRRVKIEETVSDVVEDPTTTLREIANSKFQTNAFDAMRKATKAAQAAAAMEAFDKKKSEAKGMVEEQAQESEDEYAGLGGASDEDSGEEDDDIKAMMDHGEIHVDESKLAGFYA